MKNKDLINILDGTIIKVSDDILIKISSGSVFDYSTIEKMIIRRISVEIFEKKIFFSRRLLFIVINNIVHLIRANAKKVSKIAVSEKKPNAEKKIAILLASCLLIRGRKKREKRKQNRKKRKALEYILSDKNNTVEEMKILEGLDMVSTVSTVYTFGIIDKVDKMLNFEINNLKNKYLQLQK